MEGEKVTKLNK